MNLERIYISEDLNAEIQKAHVLCFTLKIPAYSMWRVCVCESE